MNKTISTIENGIKLFDSIHKIWKSSKTKIINQIREPKRLVKLSDEFFNSEIKYGSLITTSGFLPNYGYTYRPKTYITTIPYRGKDENTGLKFDQKMGRMVEEHKMTVKFRLFQFPIQIIPPFENELGKFRVLYLYPDEFVSFILSEDADKKKNKITSDHLKITNDNMAVPILLNEAQADKYSNSFIKITGVISPIPNDQIEYFSNYLCDTRRQFYYNFYRPYSPNFGYCIDCRDYLNYDIKLINKINNLSGALYVEAHFENLDDTKYDTFIDKAIPNKPAFNFAYHDLPGITHYITDSDVSVIGIKPYTYGFYIETDLLDSRKFEISLKKLQTSYDLFRKKASSLMRKEFSLEARLKPDFIFDFRRQKLFHPDGVLVSKEVENILEKDQNLIDTIKWLKQ